jgi:hypothetical protein
MNRPMQKIYLVIRSALVFFFVISLIDEGLAITGRTGGKIVLSLVFGALMLLIPYILGFFKITINFWSSMLMGILIALVYILIMYLGIGQLLYFTEPAVLDLGLGENTVFVMDKLTLLLVIPVLSAGGSILLDKLSES